MQLRTLDVRTWRSRVFLAPPGAVALGAAAAAIGLTCLIALFASQFRGAGFDEFATLYYSDPTIPLAKAWREVWPQETLPPLFYAVGRLARTIAGDDLSRLRLLNFPAMVAVLAWAASVWRGAPQRRIFLLVFAVLCFCGKTTFTFYPYFRNYYWQWAAETIFVGAAVCDCLERRQTPNPWFLAATPFVFWLHQMTALYAAPLALAIAWDEARRRQWTRLSGLVVAVCVGLIPLAYFTSAQYGIGGQAYRLVDWIPAHSRLGAIGVILGGIAMALGQNWAAPALLAFNWKRLPRLAQGEREVVLALAIVLVAATAAAEILDAFKPIAVSRYFGLASIEVAAMFALALAPLAARHGGALLLLAANAAIFALTFGVHEAIKQNYDGGAQIIASIVRACPTTTVHPGNRQLDYRDALAYDYLSRRYGFAITPSRPDIPTACPALYWVEGVRVRRSLTAEQGSLSRAANEISQIGLGEEQLRQARTIRSSQGLIIAVGGEQFAQNPLMRAAIP